MLKFICLIALSLTFLFALSVDDTRHLMSRTSFGIDKNMVKILSSKNKKDAINFLFKINQNEDLQPLPNWAENSLKRDKPFKMMTASEKKKYFRELRKRIVDLKEWWVKSMLDTNSPMREKLTLFWHNHFTSSVKKVKSPSLMLEQNQLLRKYSLGNFRILLHKISKNPAMILYLDNQSNKKRKPNENYAREVMELFTLGEGHYSETDIKEAARAFSGWRVNRKKGNKFVFVKKLHDFGKKEFLGETGNFDGDDILDIILEKKQTARFITTKFYKEFINDSDINELEIDRIADIFYNSDYDIKTLLKGILLSKDFWDTKNRGVLVKSPIELIVGTLRSFDIHPKNTKGLVRASKNLKQDIFNPPNVKGWDGGTSWLDSNSIIFRNQVVSRFVRGKEMGMDKNMMMKKSNSIFEDNNLNRNERFKFMQHYLLALTPISKISHNDKMRKIISEFIKDPVYQLK